jgi:hypothetical protein
MMREYEFHKFNFNPPPPGIIFRRKACKSRKVNTNISIAVLVDTQVHDDYAQTCMPEQPSSFFFLLCTYWISPSFRFWHKIQYGGRTGERTYASNSIFKSRVTFNLIYTISYNMHEVIL